MALPFIYYRNYFNNLNIMKKVLIVEDDKDFLWLLRQNFDKQPFSVVYADDGEKGLAMAQEEKPDLIVIDIVLPKMDGITMAKKIREKGVKSQMIFLTNLKDPEHISKALETVGETDYIVKADIQLDVIVERIKKKLGVL